MAPPGLEPIPSAEWNGTGHFIPWISKSVKLVGCAYLRYAHDWCDYVGWGENFVGCDSIIPHATEI
jgi:hypothetical protein